MEDLHLVEIGYDVCASDPLPRKPSGRPPEAGGPKARGELVVDRVRDIFDRSSWRQRERLLVDGKGVGGTRYGLKMAVRPTASGCAFTVTLELGGAPLFGPIGAAAARAVKGDIERSIRRFEELYV